MLLATPQQGVRSIGTFLADSGYDHKHLLDELELGDPPYATGENLEALLLKTEGDAVLPVLARLFYVGWPIEEARCARVLPEDVLSAALDCGLLTRVDGKLEAPASLMPFRDHLIACDCPRTRGNNPDMVLGPGSATHFLARLAAGGEEESTLDVGSGSGVLAIEAAGYSRQVTGTDINARTFPFASFNATLNGVANTEFLYGDAFGPVAGQRFSRIIANPPFLLNPGKKLTHCDSPLELDGFAHRLATECSDYLEEGGYFQMICQWVELEKHTWQERLREWTAASGCDVLVLLAPSSTPIAYAELRAKEARQSYSTPAEFDVAARFHYLRERGVAEVLSGVITMRKRKGVNWFSILGTAPAGPKVGRGIRERFETLTFLATSSEAEIFETRFRFAADVILETKSEPGVPQWTTLAVDLVKSETLVDRLRLDEVVAGCLPFFDGRRTLREVSEHVSAKLGIAPEEAQQRCLQLARRLLKSSFVVPV